MSAITPQTELRLIKCPIENDNRHQINFATKEAQYTYFNSLPHLTVDNFTYQRKDGIIRYPEHIDNIIGYTYVMYQNSAYTDKWFYAFITNMQYVNDKMTEITIKTDVFQTWQFDLVYKKSFVEREHVNDDVAGNYTLPEDLELGEFVQSGEAVNLNNYNTGTYICIQASELIPEVEFASSTKNKIVNGIYQGCYFMIFTDSDYASNMIEIYDRKGKGDAIVAVFLVPKAFGIGEETTAIVGNAEGLAFSYLVPTSISTYTTLVSDATFNRNTTVDGYTPKNKKLLTYPFNYFNLSNNSGSIITLRYEDFTSGTPHFKIIGDLTTGCSIKCIPLNYKKISDSNSSMKSFDYGLIGGKFPTCSWNSDAYTNWLTQNGVNNALSTVASVGQIMVGTALMGTGIGAIAGAPMLGSGIGGIIDVMRQKHNASFMPDQAKGNTNCGDVVYSAGKNVFTCYKLCVRNEVAKSIDEFFSTFGYKVHRVKIPNITGRTNWNYVKTVNMNVEGDVPDSDIQEIKNMFNNGVTFWHNPAYFLDYSQSNAIV